MHPHIDKAIPKGAPMDLRGRTPGPFDLIHAARNANLKRTPKAVLVILATHLKPEGRWSLTWDGLAFEVGCARSTIKRHCRELRRLGLIDWRSTRNPETGNQGANSFEMNYEQVQNLARGPLWTSGKEPQGGQGGQSGHPEGHIGNEQGSKTSGPEVQHGPHPTPHPNHKNPPTRKDDSLCGSGEIAAVLAQVKGIAKAKQSNNSKEHDKAEWILEGHECGVSGPESEKLYHEFKERGFRDFQERPIGKPGHFQIAVIKGRRKRRR